MATNRTNNLAILYVPSSTNVHSSDANDLSLVSVYISPVKLVMKLIKKRTTHNPTVK